MSSLSSNRGSAFIVEVILNVAPLYFLSMEESPTKKMGGREEQALRGQQKPVFKNRITSPESFCGSDEAVLKQQG